MAWLTPWLYRLPVTVTNGSTTSALAYCQVDVIISGAAYTSLSTHALGSRADLRVTDSDGTTLLPHWFEDEQAGTQIALKVKMSLAAKDRKSVV